MQQCGFLYQSGAGQLVDQRFSMFKCRSDPPDAGNLGGMVKLKPAPPSKNKVISSIHKRNGTSQPKN